MAAAARRPPAAVVELASTSGITLLDPLAPLDAHTAGFGEAIASALDHGVERLLLALGGSASTDGGVGALAALGDASSTPPGGRSGSATAVSARSARVDLTDLRPLPPGGAVILSDVDNPLLGARGAAAVFGPQKGADAAMVDVLESNLARLARLLPADPTPPGAGAAGGTGFGLLAWGARMGGGAGVVAEAMGLPAALEGAELVITGEGRFDGQTAAGKVPGGRAARAGGRRAGRARSGGDRGRCRSRRLRGIRVALACWPAAPKQRWPTPPLARGSRGRTGASPLSAPSQEVGVARERSDWRALPAGNPFPDGVAPESPPR